MSGAEAAFGRILEQEPNHVDALVGRAHALQALRRPDEALAGLERALALEPADPAILGNHARVLAMLGRPADALVSLERALQLAGDNFWLVNNRANVLLLLGRHAEALQAYDTALRLNPESPDVLYNRARLLLELQRPEEARDSLEQAVRLSPDFAEAHGKHGVALFTLKRYEEALASFDRAARLKPNDALAWNQRGAVLLGLQRTREALADFERAVQLEPQYAEALANRGTALQRLRHFPAAIRDYEQALNLKPRLLEALNNRANVLLDLRRYEEAIRAFDELLEASPDYPYAAGYRFHASLHCCEWSNYQAHRQALAEKVADGTQLDVPFQFLMVSADPAAQLRCARAFVAAGHPAPAPLPPASRPRATHHRIRVAYLSADFGEHATANLIAGLFEAHDRARFELTALSFGVHPESAMKARLSGAFERFLDVHAESDRAIAARLQELEIDIAVDLKGITSESRLGIFAYHAAPIQVSYLGYPGTIGAPYIDYLLADECVIPPDERAHYAERVVYLPDSYQVNDSRRAIAPGVPQRAEARLPPDAFVFCCFNSCYKITPEVFDVWMRLLAGVDGSVLWLLEGNAAAARNLEREARQRGIDPQRLIFAPPKPHAEYLAQHRLADLFLDTLPINAHTTASDALWAGLPVLTCRGSAFAGRVAASLLRAVGLPELITESLAGYEALALELAKSPERLSELRARLERNRLTSPLFDTRRFCRHIEAAYGEMWERHQRGEPPQSFAVGPR